MTYDPEFAARFEAAGWRIADERRAWFDHMASRYGVRIAAPDDGWVDRERHTFRPVAGNCDWISDAIVGDRIALGGPDRWRVVRVTAVKRGWLTDEPIYSFDPDPVAGFNARAERKARGATARLLRATYRTFGTITAAVFGAALMSIESQYSATPGPLFVIGLLVIIGAGFWAASD